MQALKVLFRALPAQGTLKTRGRERVRGRLKGRPPSAATAQKATTVIILKAMGYHTACSKTGKHTTSKNNRWIIYRTESCPQNVNMKPSTEPALRSETRQKTTMDQPRPHIGPTSSPKASATSFALRDNPGCFAGVVTDRLAAGPGALLLGVGGEIFSWSRKLLAISH